MVKRGVSGTFERVTPPESNRIVVKTLSKASYILGIGILSSYAFRNDQFPLQFYFFNIIIAFIIYSFSLYQISYLSQNAKLDSIIGVAALNTSVGTLFTVFSLFIAIISIAGIAFRMTFILTAEILSKNFNFSSPVSIWMIPIIFGLIYLTFVLLVRNREISYFWARYLFLAILIGNCLFKLCFDAESVSNYFSESLAIPLIFSGTLFKESLTVIGVTLAALFCGTACDPDILKARKEKDSNMRCGSSFFSTALLSTFALLFNLVLLIVHRDGCLSQLFDDKLISNCIIRSVLGFLLVISIFIHSCEYLDIAHNLIYGFFKPLTDESLKSFKSFYVREIYLILCVFGVSYFIGGSGSGIQRSNLAISMNYVFCLTLSVPFLILPPIFMINKLRKCSRGIAVLQGIHCFLIGSIGILLITSNIFGLASIQDSKISEIMILFSRDSVVMILLSAVVYLVFMILDVIVYPPLLPSPISHRAINISESNVYGENYIVEVLIVAFILTTYSASDLFIVRDWSSGVYENIFIIMADYLIRIFLHGDILHLLLNSLSIYFLGKSISKEIGPFHFVAFFIVSGLVSKVGSSIIWAHTRFAVVQGIGASGAIFALSTKYLFVEGYRHRLFCFSLSGHESMVFIISLCVFLILTNLIRRISHEGHLCGYIFGLIFWEISEMIWKFKNTMYKKLNIQRIK